MSFSLYAKTSISAFCAVQVTKNLPSSNNVHTRVARWFIIIMRMMITRAAIIVSRPTWGVGATHRILCTWLLSKRVCYLPSFQLRAVAFQWKEEKLEIRDDARRGGREREERLGRIRDYEGWGKRKPSFFISLDPSISRGWRMRLLRTGPKDLLFLRLTMKFHRSILARPRSVLAIKFTPR